MPRTRRRQRQGIKEPAYRPPTAGDICFVRKSFKEWSSGSQVEIVSCDGIDDAIVMHQATRKIFEIPVDYLVRRRKRH